MKIGLVISSLTQSVPYMTYLISLGYDVFPIILKTNIDNILQPENYLGLKKLVEFIAQKTILFDDNKQELEKLDCLIIMPTSEKIYSLINYHNLLKESAPIICESSNIDELSDLLISYNNINIINCKSKDIIHQCDMLISNLQKILTKNK